MLLINRSSTPRRAEQPSADVHSANPAGVAKAAQVLRHWGYRVRVASGCTDVGYLDGPA